jgi:hypothetical protein
MWMAAGWGDNFGVCRHYAGIELVIRLKSDIPITIHYERKIEQTGGVFFRCMSFWAKFVRPDKFSGDFTPKRAHDNATGGRLAIGQSVQT